MTQLSTKNDLALLLGASRLSAWRTVRFADVCQLTKPRITVMVLVTAGIGYLMALRGQQGGTIAAALAASPWKLLLTLVGTGLSCMGASAINQVLERDVDALMPRTRNRPLPTGRMDPAAAAGLGALLSLLGVSVLALGATPLAALLSALTIGSYAFVYTPMKRMGSYATIVGAGPGALPPVIGAAAATGMVGREALLLFLILFLWQLPHFLAIAWLYREDYAAGGIPVLPVEDPHGQSTFRQILLGCVVLLPLGLLPGAVRIAGMMYFIGALLCGLGFLAAAVALALRPSRKAARWTFFVSLLYLPLVYGLMLADQLV